MELIKLGGNVYLRNHDLYLYVTLSLRLYCLNALMAVPSRQCLNWILIFAIALFCISHLNVAAVHSFP